MKGRIEETKEEVKLHSVLPCLCTKRGVMPQTLKSIPKELGRVYINDRGFLDESRNACVDHFLASDKEYLMWIDDDIILADNIVELLKLHFPMIAPTCWVSKIRPTFGIYSYEEVKGHPNHAKVLFNIPIKTIVERAEECVSKNEPPLMYKVDAVGGGCYLVRRDVFKKTKDKDGEWYKISWYDDYDNLCRGEDIYFFNNCLKHNLHFVVHLGVENGHYILADNRITGRWFYSKRPPVIEEEQKYVEYYNDLLKKQNEKAKA
jgi:hypothetical protein